MIYVKGRAVFFISVVSVASPESKRLRFASIGQRGFVVMSFDAVSIVALFVGTIFIVIVSIEGGYVIGRMAHRRSEEEKESPVSAIAGAVLALLAFILAFTFGIASNRFDARKELVRDEANKVRTAWLRSDFLPEPDRAEAKGSSGNI